MGTKKEPGEYDCYEALMDDEPYFVLSARDPDAPFLVRAWARQRDRNIDDGQRPITDKAKVAEARKLADQMETWRKENDGVWRAPKSEPDGVEVLPSA